VTFPIAWRIPAEPAADAAGIEREGAAAGPWPYTAVREKRALIASLPAVDVALDLGAANGEYVPHLLERARRVVAVDIDPARVAQLRERFRGERRVTVVRASADALPFATRSFGLVWASEIVEHLPTLDASLSEIERVCGGSVLATLPAPLSPYRFLDPTHRLPYSLASLRADLRARTGWSYELEGLGLCLPQWLGLDGLRERWVRASRRHPAAAWTLLVRGRRR
jgi:SAM-dependent methyltransferase